MLLALFALACLVAGHAASGRLLGWREDEGATGPVERTAASLICAVAIAIGVDWSLALVHLYVPWALVVASIALLAACVPTLRRIGRAMTQETGIRGASLAIVLVPLAPVIAWVVYVLWRGWLLWVTDHDGLAYHLLKAAFTMKAHGYGYFDGQIPAVTTFPIDYELLLGDVMLLTGADRVTEWIATFTFVLYGLTSGAIAERWWGRGLHVVVAMIFAWAVPLAILHSGTHKNDLLFAVAVLGAAHFGARWAVGGKPGPYVIAVACLAIAGGTKVSGAFLCAATLVPFAVRARAWWKGGRQGGRAIVGWGAITIAILGLFGWATYLLNAFQGGRLVGVNRAGWGAWNNLWQFTYLCFARPFSPSGAVWVPWQGRPWFWNTNDLYFGTLGLETSLALFALPFGVWRYRRAAPEERARERALASIVPALTAILIIPTYPQPPLGFFAQSTRYMLMLPPIFAAWTIVPLVREIGARGSAGRAIAIATTIAYGAVFGVTAFLYGKNDIYTPFAYFEAAVKEPEKYERYVNNFFVHAGVWVDHHAGPDDVVAFDGSFDSWPYPVLGRGWTRRLVFLHPEEGVPVTIPDDVKWVVVDRGWNRLFNNADFKDFGDWDRYFLRGQLEPVDIVTEMQLAKDDRFELVFHDRRFNQSVFRRKE